MIRPRKLAAALLATCIATSASAQPVELCTRTDDDRTALGFGIEPSMVEHSAVLDVTFEQAELDGGAPGERVFSFAHTIGQILQSAGATNDAAAREAFLQTMLDTFTARDGHALNRDAGVLMPLERRGERELVASELLDEGSDNAMRPLGLFNRFDLAPADWSHCGEHRIVYGKKHAKPTDRFLLIFEAVVPNPDPSSGEAGCRRVAEFWAGLSGVYDATELARRFAAFYYEGKTDPTLAQADLLGPVVHFRNYGGDGTRGQVRGNLFVQPAAGADFLPWQLREWLTQPTIEPGKPLSFVVETVKNNPLAELYMDDISSSPALADANVASALTVLHGDFIRALTTTIRRNLMPEENQNYRDLVSGLNRFDLGTEVGEHVTEQKILLNAFGLGNDNRFNEFQSSSLGDDDQPVLKATSSSKVRAMLDKLGASPSQFLDVQTGETILNRAQAATCAGCHQTGVGKTVRAAPGGKPVSFPEVAGDGFVHVFEKDRTLSPALTEVFLPFRRYLMGRHLCGAMDAPMIAAVATSPGEPGLTVAEMALLRDPRYTNDIVESFMAAAGETVAQPMTAAAPTSADAPSDILMQAASVLDEPARETLRLKLRDEIAARRRIEAQLPGAFVETRRPH